MPRALTAVVATLACLAVAAPADAKRITSARVCGASECRQITAKGLLFALPDTGPPAPPPSHPSGGWYRTTVTMEGDEGEGVHETFAVAAFPRAGYVRTEDPEQPRAWMPMTADAARAYRKVTSGLAPRPLSRLPGFKPGNGPGTIEPAPAGDPFPWLLVVAVVALGGAGTVVLLRRRRPATP